MSDLVTEYTTARKNLEEKIRDIKALTGILTELEADLRAVIDEDKPAQTLQAAALKTPSRKTSVAKVPTNQAVEKEIVELIKSNPGIGRKQINIHFRNHKELDYEGLTNAIGRLSKAKKIENRGGRRTSQWYAKAE